MLWVCVLGARVLWVHVCAGSEGALGACVLGVRVLWVHVCWE